MSGSIFVDPPGMEAAARGAKTLAGDVHALASELGAIHIPPGSRAAPQAKLGTLSRRTVRLANSLASLSPHLSAAAEAARRFEASPFALHGPLVDPPWFKAPPFISPFGNVDGHDHPGSDVLSGIAAPFREVISGLSPKSLIEAVAIPPQERVRRILMSKGFRWAIANPRGAVEGMLRSQVLADEAATGDMDYVWSRRFTEIALTLAAPELKAEKLAGRGSKLSRDYAAGQERRIKDAKRTIGTTAGSVFHQPKGMEAMNESFKDRARRISELQRDITERQRRAAAARKLANQIDAQRSPGLPVPPAPIKQASAMIGTAETIKDTGEAQEERYREGR